MSFKSKLRMRMCVSLLESAEVKFWIHIFFLSKMFLFQVKMFAAAAVVVVNLNDLIYV